METQVWDVNNALVSRERGADGDIVGLHHPMYPYRRIAQSGQTGHKLLDMAKDYRAQVAAVLGIAHAGGAFELVWLPLDHDPRNSIVVTRRDMASTQQRALDHSVSLFAVPMWTNTSDRLGARLGLRVHVRLQELPLGKWSAAFLGASVSAELPAFLDPAAQSNHDLLSPLRDSANLRLTLRLARSKIADAQQVDPAQLKYDGVRPNLNTRKGLQLYLNRAKDAKPEDPAPQAQTASWMPVQGTSSALIEDAVISLESHPLVAHVANASASLFTRDTGFAALCGRLSDPASQMSRHHIADSRPNRSSPQLEGYRSAVFLEPALPAGEQALKDPGDWFMVVRSDLPHLAKSPGDVVVLDPSQLPRARTNDFAAVSAFHQTGLMFQAIDNGGLDRGDFFRFAEKPLRVHYRSGIRPGPGKNGNTVNAQVEFEPPHCDFYEPWSATVVRPMHMRYALADILRSSSSREPLGLATDPRWCWHEFGHVLLAGSTGKLELAFVHSIGDALAAVANDPHSELVDDDRPAQLRGATFPWARISRRHDRSVFTGWSWSGSLHRRAFFDNANSNCRHKGYASEQILSTTVFRVYRSMGGDTVQANGKPDRATRKSASDFVVYLIMRATAMLGAASAVPLETAEQLAATLMDADAVTEPASAGPLAGRAGGCALKVIRWAFEAQGMYSDMAVDAIHNGPGRPPQVDLYLDDGRPDAQGPSPRGGYMPVSLDWNGARPKWHATGDDEQKTGALVVVGSRARVRVNNRGFAMATGVSVTVWWHKLTTKTSRPKWNDGNWRHKVARGPSTIVANAPGVDASGLFRCSLALATGRYLVLVQVECDQDPSIIDSAAGLPCSGAKVPLEQLVNGDNNLGLRVVRIP